MNALVETLGWTLIHSLWQGAIIGLLLAVALPALRGRSANARYLASWIALVAVAACLPVTFFSLKENYGDPLPTPDFRSDMNLATSHGTAEDAARAIGLHEHETAGDGASDFSSPLRLVRESRPWTAWIVGFWVSGTVTLALWRLVGIVGIARLRRNALREPVPEALRTLVESLRKRMGVSIRVAVRVSTRAVSPLVTGVVKPIIILPTCAVSGLAREQLEAVLAHELAHVRRHDYLLNAFQLLIETLLFYHPAVWWAGRHIRRERENCCDDAALEVCQDSRLYAGALRELAELGHVPATAVAATAGRGQLLGRLKRILGSSRRERGNAGGWLLGASLAALGVTAILAGTGMAQDEEKKEEPPDTVKRLMPFPDDRGHITDRHGVVLAGTDPYMRLVFDAHLPVEKEAKKETEEAFEKYLEERLVPALKMEGIGLDVVEVTNARVTWKRTKHFSWNLDSGSEAEMRFRNSGRQLGIPRVVVERTVRRTYPLGATAAHTLGFVGRGQVGMGEGRAGVEKSADAHLRSVGGDVERRFDKEGRFLGERRLRAGGPPSDVALTMDARKQFVAEQTFRDAGIGRGAAVLMDVATGDVLAMVSVPSYDLNDWVPFVSRETYGEYMRNAAKPLFNRALGSFAAASTFKVFSGLVEPVKPSYVCKATVMIDDRAFRCWEKRGHGELGLHEALVRSCNCYFYQHGIDVGANRLAEVSRAFRFGKKSGVELQHDAAGFVPDPASVQERYDTAWSNGNTAIMAIGHGYLQVSPIQLAAATAAIANDGRYQSPRLLLEVVDDDERKRFERPQSVNLTDTVTLDRIKEIRAAMRDVVNGEGGTGSRARSDLLAIAGKTGTAQFRRDGVLDNHAVFIGFAPYEKPKYALSVLVRGGKTGGRVAAPLAKRILEACHRIDRGEVPEVKRLAPVEGHMDPVEEVKFAD